MPEARASYTRYPRAILWLVRGDASVASFYLSKLPISNSQFEAFDATFERAANSAGDDDPAVNIGHDQALAYCAWYAEVSLKETRLPTEAEWKHACRGGEPVCGEESIPVLKKTRTNANGLHAMLGGVWEWTGEGVLRGGSYRTPPDDIGRDAHLEVEPGYRTDDVGFRIARPLPGSG